MTSSPRNRERGSVALLIAVMWTTLFGMAVVAVDFGYLYTKRRNVQAVADAAVMAGMPLLATSGTTARDRALAVARKNGFTPGTDATATVTGSELTVALERTYPTFFGSVLGFTPKKIKATSIGRLNSVTGPAIHAIDRLGGCDPVYTWGVGVTVTGGGKLTINGDVEARNKVELMSDDPTCTPATCKVAGTARSACAVYNNSVGKLDVPNVVIGGSTDPLAANTLATLGAFCTGGTSIATAIGAIPMSVVGACTKIDPGVYCSNGDISVNPVGTMSFCPTNVTFIAGGTIQIGGDGAITFTAAAGVPNQIIAFSNSAAAPAIQLSNGPLGLFTLNGSVYAPNGNINLGTGTPGFTMTGMLVADTINIAMGPGQPWVFNGPSGGSSGWRLYK